MPDETNLRGAERSESLLLQIAVSYPDGRRERHELWAGEPWSHSLGDTQLIVASRRPQSLDPWIVEIVGSDGGHTRLRLDGGGWSCYSLGLQLQRVEKQIEVEFLVTRVPSETLTEPAAKASSETWRLAPFVVWDHSAYEGIFRNVLGREPPDHIDSIVPILESSSFKDDDALAAAADWIRIVEASETEGSPTNESAEAAQERTMSHWQNADPRSELVDMKRATIVILRPDVRGKSRWEAGLGFVETKNDWHVRTTFENHSSVGDEGWDPDWLWTLAPEVSRSR